MLIEEQEEIIAMLERLRAKKRYHHFSFFFLRNCIRAEFFFFDAACRLQLRDFSDKEIDTKAAGHCVPAQYAGGSGGGAGGGATGSNAQMEVDSNASTPA